MSEKQKTILKQIRNSIPGAACYTLYVVLISGGGWIKKYITENFIEDYPAMACFDYLEEVCNDHPDDLHWDVRSEAYEFGNRECGSDPIPNHILALIQEFGLEDFLALPEVRLIDNNSFMFEIQE